MSPKIKHRALAKQGTQNGNSAIVETYMERQSFLPPPAELERYEELYPNITKILVDEFRSQSEHRRSLEQTVVNSEVKSAKRGQVFAFILCTISIIVGFVLILLEKHALGLGTIITPLCSVFGAFVYGTKSKRKERIEKSKANP